MNRAERAVRRLDRLQQRNAWLAFPVAVWKKFGDDQAGNLAALLAYYAFASLLPLLLVFMTVLDLVLRGDPALRDRLRESVFGQFPGLSSELQNNVHGLGATGFALVVGLLFAFLGARGVASAAQTALNKVWAVPYDRRPGFPWNQLRSIGLIVAVGLGVIITSVLSGLALGAGNALNGAGAYAGAAVSLVLNIGLFWLGFRLATAREVTTRELLPGALGSAAVWQVLQLLGGYIVAHELARSRSLYGVFGIVLGLLAWLYLQAQATLYAVEASVVSAKRLWPRSLTPPPFTPADLRAYDLYATAGQRLPDERIRVDVDSPAGPR